MPWLAAVCDVATVNVCTNSKQFLVKLAYSTIRALPVLSTSVDSNDYLSNADVVCYTYTVHGRKRTFNACTHRTEQKIIIRHTRFIIEGIYPV